MGAVSYYKTLVVVQQHQTASQCKPQAGIHLLPDNLIKSFHVKQAAIEELKECLQGGTEKNHLLSIIQKNKATGWCICIMC